MEKHPKLLHNYVDIVGKFGGEIKMVEHIAKDGETCSRFLGVFNYSPKTHCVDTEVHAAGRSDDAAGRADVVISEKAGEKPVHVVEFMSMNNGGCVDEDHYLRLPRYCLDLAKKHRVPMVAGTMVCSPAIPLECLVHFSSKPVAIDFLVVTGLVNGPNERPFLDFHRHPLNDPSVGVSATVYHFARFCDGLSEFIMAKKADGQIPHLRHEQGERYALWGGKNHFFSIEVFQRKLYHQFILFGKGQKTVHLFECLKGQLEQIKEETGVSWIRTKEAQSVRRILFSHEDTVNDVIYDYTEQEKSDFYNQLIQYQCKFIKAIENRIDKFDQENPA